MYLSVHALKMAVFKIYIGYQVAHILMKMRGIIGAPVNNMIHEYRFSLPGKKQR